MTTPFPLLRLPYLVLMPVLEQMELMDRITLSVLSKRARMFVKLLKMKCEHINLILKYGTIEMTVVFDDSEELKVNMYIHRHRVDLRYKNDYISWWPGVPPTYYALPIMDVTHCESIKKLTFPEVAEYDPEYDATIPLLTKLPKIDEIVVEDFTSYNFSPDSPLRNVLKFVLPVSSAVTISDHVRKPKFIREILQGNFDAVNVQLLEDNDWRFPLNDLRNTNAKTLKIEKAAFRVEDLNLYFKLWMKKECNPRLEYLEMRAGGNMKRFK